MKTDNIDAWQVQAGDQITLNGEEVYLVREVNDTERVLITFEDEDGMCETLPFDPDDILTLYLGEDDVEFEDVEVDPD